ncbi:MAG: TetR/AcrR family transcriptional regulator [Candidatus Lokiarchaeota archaeon]|nr:TetR/AcrR family transcriptional regulator [Candidatus Lokiarchaeota archaeon]
MINKKSNNTNNKKTRSRSPEKKARQLDEILELGKQLFQEEGRDGFTLRGLSNKLDMSQNNIYNYVESKRELWIAIRKKFYEQYRNETRDIIKNFSGSTVELLLNIFEHFFEFAEKDYAAFRMMHIIRSPPSDKVGPFEREYKQFSYLDGTTKVIQKAIDEGEIKEKNASMLSFFLFSILLGTTMVEYVMRETEEINNKKEKELNEYMQFASQNFTSKEFRKYVLKKIEKGLNDPNLLLDESEYKEVPK